MGFKLGPKTIIVNDGTVAPIQYLAVKAGGLQNLYEVSDDFGAAAVNLATSPDTQTSEGADYSPATQANAAGAPQADMLRIVGFADFKKSNVISAVGAKGVTGQKQAGTVTIVLGTIVPGSELELNLNVAGTNYTADLATHLSDYKRKFSLGIVTLKAGDTATTVAAQFKAYIDSIKASNPAGLQYVTATVAAGVLTLTATTPELTFTVDATGTAIDNASATATYAQTVVGYPGRNTWTQLKGVRLPTVNGAFVEERLTDQVPLKNAKYSSYLITIRVDRPDLAGLAGGLNQDITGQFQYLIYVNETQTQYITDLTQWLNANVPTRAMYTATTANAAAAAETPVTATTVDASAPFTTPIV